MKAARQFHCQSLRVPNRWKYVHVEDPWKRVYQLKVITYSVNETHNQPLNHKPSPFVLGVLVGICHNLGSAFLRLNHIDVTKHSCIRSWTIAEIIREKSVVFMQLHVLYLFNMCYPYTAQVRPWACAKVGYAERSVLCKVLGNLRNFKEIIASFGY